MIANVFYNMLN
jgi:hypothetical protein